MGRALQKAPQGVPLPGVVIAGRSQRILLPSYIFIGPPWLVSIFDAVFLLVFYALVFMLFEPSIIVTYLLLSCFL